MRWRSRRRDAATLALVVVAAVLSPGCTSPPSVTPLLRVAEAAMHDEAARLAADVERDRQGIDAARRQLRAGFDLDLQQRSAIDPAWVTQAVDVYVAASEALVRHEMALAAERRRRAENLVAAAEATRRATELLERQDALITRTVRADVWRLLRGAREVER